LTRLARPLDKARVHAADDDFYAKHPEFVRDGKRIPLSETNPAQAALRREWVQAYEKHGGEVEAPESKPPPQPVDVVQPCPASPEQKPPPAALGIEDASEEEREAITQAHERAKEMIDSAITKCLEQAKSQPNALVAEYFGINGTSEADVEQIDHLIENYETMQAGMGKATYEVEHEEIKPGEPYTVAYVYTLPIVHGVGDVHVVFPAFTKSSTDDQAATLVHEMSHYAVGTDDHAYDWETTKWNKLTQAEKADNADSYGNFARDCHAAHRAGK
jgi:hypothetical protein